MNFRFVNIIFSLQVGWFSFGVRPNQFDVIRYVIFMPVQRATKFYSLLCMDDNSNELKK